MTRRMFLTTILSIGGGVACAAALPPTLFAKSNPAILPTSITLGPGSTLKNLSLSNCPITMNGNYQAVTSCIIGQSGSRPAITINSSWPNSGGM